FDAAHRWIRRRAGTWQPFFAWITPNAPHDPFISPGPEWEAPYRDRGLSTNAVRYYAMIAHLDAAVGRLLDGLAAGGLRERTLVIFLTDNGHSVPGLFNAGLRAQKGTPYEGGIRVPSFWSWPGRLPSGRDCDRLTAHLDLLPTLLELAGRPPPAGAALEGRSLVPLLENPGAAWPNRHLFTHLGRWEHGTARASAHRHAAVQDERFKLVNNVESYDLLADPGESRNLIDSHPVEAGRLRTAYAAWWESVLPAALLNEDALGPYLNPFKAAFWQQFGGGPDAALRDRMEPGWKFNPERPRF
ncbi:MAG: sulfatase-like hydrolase/transferase, partial [Verrucomicrobiota bacterium]